ncbi:MAG: hypothetical protein VR64_03165 [Desulfatitalea sp. BRH_c12]|nr:MAG: hypothetical protein VR64_03165 [Desulfatitalea sp. BRH_c12]
MKKAYCLAALLAVCLVLGAFSPAMALEAKVSGQINQMVMWADDGDEDDFFVADNDSSSTRFRFTGSEKFGAVTAGFQFEMEAQRNASNFVTIAQTDDGDFEWNDRWMNVYFDTAFGKFEIGKGDSAANNTAEVDLSGTAVVTYSDINATGGSFAWQNDDGTDFGTTISGTRNNFDGMLSRTERLRYNTPLFAGFQLAGSVSNGDGWDASLWYAAEFYGKLAAAIGYTKPEDRSAATDYQLAGSISWLAPFGLNLTASYGTRELEAPGRDDATTWMGKVGYKFDIHAVSVEYGMTSDLRLDGEDSSNWGVAYVVNPWKPVEFYAAYRHYMLDAAAGPDPEDIQVAMAGTRIKF